MARGKRQSAPETAEEKARNFVSNVLGTQEELDDEVEKRVAVQLESQGIPSEETSQALADDEVKRKLRQEGVFNLFNDIEKNHFRAGDGIDVEYTIFVNGAMKASRNHPYTWDKLQMEFPEGGRFKVVAYSVIDKEYIAQETRNLAPYSGKLPQNNDSHQAPAPQEQRSSTKELMELAAFMQQLNPPKTDSSSEMMKLMMEMQKSNMDMMMKMQENTTSVIKEVANNFGSAIKEVKEQIEKTATGKKDEGFSVLEIMKMQSDARKEGYEQRKELEDMVEARAEERADLLAEASGNAPKSSMLEKLAESFLPVVSQSMLLQQQASAAASATAAQNPARSAPARSQPVSPDRGVPESQAASAPNGGAASAGSNVRTLNGRAKFDPGAGRPKKASEDDSKMRVIMALVPAVAQAKDMNEAVEKTLVTLKGMNMPLSEALRIVSRADILEVAREKLPPETVPVLEEFYSALEAQLGAKESHEPVSNAAPSNAVGSASLN